MGPAAIPWAMAALAAASAASSISSNNKAQRRTEEQANNQALLSNNLMREQSQAMADQTGIKLTDKEREYDKTRASQRMAQAESGLSGSSALREVANTYMQQSFDMSSIIEEGSAAQRGEARQAQGNFNQSMSTYNTAKGNTVGGFSAGLQIATGTASGAMQGYSASK